MLDWQRLLRTIAGEEDGDGVEVRAGQAPHPMVGVIRARVAEDLRPGDHALLELFGERAQRRLVHPSARRPFQVKPTVTQRLSSSTEARASAADCTVGRMPVSHLRPAAGLRKDRNSCAPRAAGLGEQEC